MALARFMRERRQTTPWDAYEAPTAESAPAAPAAPATATFTERTRNPLRPATLADMVGQAKLKSMLRRVIDAALASGQPLDHLLLVGASGTGKSTIANIIGEELGRRVFQVEAPVSSDTLLDLRTTMSDGDVLFIDEIHMQAVQERRGKTSSTQPEVLFNVMEDRTIVSGSSVLPFPAVTVIGATTDEGMLPDPFINRFPFRPVIAPYSVDDLTVMARHNATALACVIDIDAARLFAGACRSTPRVLNNYVKNAQALTALGVIDRAVAEEVLFDLNHVTTDGLTIDQQNVLTFMYSRCRRESPTQGVRYMASVSTIATAIGKSRDVKSIQLRIEPYLITSGLLQVVNGGRVLTDAGITRATELLAA